MAWPQKWTKQQPEHSGLDQGCARHDLFTEMRKLLGSPDTSHAQVDPNEAGFCHGPASRCKTRAARLCSFGHGSNFNSLGSRTSKGPTAAAFEYWTQKDRLLTNQDINADAHILHTTRPAETSLAFEIFEIV